MLLAQGLTVQSSTAKHAVGTVYDDPRNGARYVYCVDSGSGNSIYNPVYITPVTFATAALTKAAADKGYKVAVPQIAVTASYYYWAMIRSGSATAYVLTFSAAASEATLFTTASAGMLDDTPTSQTGIGGIRLTATAATAANSAVAACTIEDPEPFSVETAFDVAESIADSAATLATDIGAASAATSVASISVNASAATNLRNAFSTTASALSAGQVLDSAASIAKASHTTEGEWISHIISAAKSQYA